MNLLEQLGMVLSKKNVVSVLSGTQPGNCSSMNYFIIMLVFQHTPNTISAMVTFEYIKVKLTL